jgi:hypothetical protein
MTQTSEYGLLGALGGLVFWEILIGSDSSRNTAAAAARNRIQRWNNSSGATSTY